MRRKICHGVVVTLLGMASASALADEVRVNGFLTTSLAKLSTDETSYLGGSFTHQPRFDNPDSRLGLQFSAQVSERIDATAQLLARGRGDNNALIADWAFASIKAANDAKVRAGKLKLSTFLASDYIEVGYAYPWIRPPQEVYSLNPITTQVGVDALYTPKIGRAKLMIQPFAGSNRGTITVSPALADYLATDPANTIVAGDTLDFSVPAMYGINMALSGRSASFRLGYLQARVDQETFAIEERRADFGSAGFTVDWHDVVLYGEYVDRNVVKELEGAFPDQQAGYLTVGYRMGKFLPHLTYAAINEGRDASPLAVRQRSATAGLRYEFLDGAAMKFEAQRIAPEDDNYGYFDGKDANGNYLKDARLYGIALDVIF
ncbi:MAG TPA: hypothetical protein VGE50_08825 [Gammaproteobacteria bacterium]